MTAVWIGLGVVGVVLAVGVRGVWRYAGHNLRQPYAAMLATLEAEGQKIGPESRRELLAPDWCAFKYDLQDWLCALRAAVRPDDADFRELPGTDGWRRRWAQWIKPAACLWLGRFNCPPAADPHAWQVVGGWRPFVLGTQNGNDYRATYLLASEPGEPWWVAIEEMGSL